MNQKINVLVVDDTAFMRKTVSRILETDPDVTVAGTARDGLEALTLIKRIGPDVITLDIDMPVMDGLTAIRHIMIESPAPIVALSALFSDGAVTFEALRLGVIDFVPKPSGTISLDISQSRRQLIDRVKMACAMNLRNVRRVRLPRKWSIDERVGSLYKFYPLEYLIAIGTSLSGPNTVIRLLSKLDPTLPAAVIVVQELSPQILKSFVEKFNEYVPWRIAAAENGTLIEQGICYLCSNEYSLMLQLNDRGDTVIALGKRSAHPLNLLFRSAAEIFRQQTVGILLTGVGDDGADGFGRIKALGGSTIVQDTQCCVFPNLTDNAVQQGVVDLSLTERRLPGAIESLMQ